MKNNKVVKIIIWAVMITAGVLADQLSKSYMVNHLKGHTNIVWIKNVFELEYCENTGAAFSSFLGKQTFLICLTAVILFVVLWELFRVPDTKRFIGLRLSFIMLIAGALGNLIDRIKQGYVVDFFYFVPINFPRFNVADVFVCCAAILLGVLLLFVYSEKETDFMFKIKKTPANNDKDADANKS